MRRADAAACLATHGRAAGDELDAPGPAERRWPTLQAGALPADALEEIRGSSRALEAAQATAPEEPAAAGPRGLQPLCRRLKLDAGSRSSCQHIAAPRRPGGGSHDLHRGDAKACRSERGRELSGGAEAPSLGEEPRVTATRSQKSVCKPPALCGRSAGSFHRSQSSGEVRSACRRRSPDRPSRPRSARRPRRRTKNEGRRRRSCLRQGAAKAQQRGEGEPPRTPRPPAAHEKLKKHGKRARRRTRCDPEEQAEELAAAVEVDPDAVEERGRGGADRRAQGGQGPPRGGPPEGLPHLRRGERRAARGHRLVGPDRRRDVDVRRQRHRDRRRAEGGAAPGGQAARSPPRGASRPGGRGGGGEGGGRRAGSASRNDPVRLYLRKMGSVSLLTREGEVEIAKRIEEGEKEVLRAAARLPARGRGDPRHRQPAQDGQAARPRGGEGRARGGRRRSEAEEAEVEVEAPRRRGGRRRSQLEPERAQPHRADLQAASSGSASTRKEVDALEETLERRRSSPRRKRKELRQEIKDARDQDDGSPGGDAAQQEADRPHRRCNLKRAHRAGGEGGGRAARAGARATASRCSDLRPLLARGARRTRPTRKKLPARLQRHRRSSSRRSTATSAPRVRKIKRVEEEANLPVDAAAPQLRGDPRRRAQGRAGQDRAGRGQPAPGGLHRQEVHQPRPAVPRPDPGGEHRPDEGGGQVRVQARLQVLAPTPPGGSARPSPAPSPTRPAPSASRCT